VLDLMSPKVLSFIISILSLVLSLIAVVNNIILSIQLRYTKEHLNRLNNGGS